MCVWDFYFDSLNFFSAHGFYFFRSVPEGSGGTTGRNMALGDAWKQLSWFYYQYLLVTALYMLEPWERTIFSILFS